MIEVMERDDERSVVSPAARLIFRRVGERWSHAIEVAGIGIFSESVEADPSRGDPRIVVSPTYQELHLERRGLAVLALLVGQFGPHHFSAAIRVEERDRCGPPGLTILVDVADRCRGEVAALAATYDVLSASATSLREASDRSISWGLPSGGITLEVDGDLGSSLAIGESLATAIRTQAIALVVPGRSTHRLAYRWTVVGREAERRPG